MSTHIAINLLKFQKSIFRLVTIPLSSHASLRLHLICFQFVIGGRDSFHTKMKANIFVLYSNLWVMIDPLHNTSWGWHQNCRTETISMANSSRTSIFSNRLLVINTRLTCQIYMALLKVRLIHNFTLNFPRNTFALVLVAYFSNGFLESPFPCKQCKL